MPTLRLLAPAALLALLPACSCSRGPPLDLRTATALAAAPPDEDITLELPEGAYLVEDAEDSCLEVTTRTEFAAAIQLGWLTVECRDGVPHLTNTDPGRRLGTWSGGGTTIVVAKAKTKVTIPDPPPKCDGEKVTVTVVREAVPTQLGRQMTQAGATQGDVGGAPVTASFEVQCTSGVWSRI